MQQIQFGDGPSPQSSRPTSAYIAPSRVSSLYQYHNAPEVAPGHGLEYDDTSYLSSDKYTVSYGDRSRPPSSSYRPGYDNSNVKSPLIIFGMKIRTFVIVAVVMVLIIVGASVGGAVGGRDMHGGNIKGQLGDGASPNAAYTPSAPSQTSQAAAAAAAAAATPSDYCPSSNGTLYTSTTADSSSSFTTYCGFLSPLSGSSGSSSSSSSSSSSTAKTSTSMKVNTTTIAQAFVSTLNDCIDICAAMNYYASSSSKRSNSRSCSIAVFDPSATRPISGPGSEPKTTAEAAVVNCWIGSADDDVSGDDGQDDDDYDDDDDDEDEGDAARKSHLLSLLRPDVADGGVGDGAADGSSGLVIALLSSSLSSSSNSAT
ncbi:hypothetical protein AAFC00_000542 [Neodothiora populina]|uniref:Uncharacterized protein n=1 Tax=Neodothiora populina TaxID=2781224 RepID=A0ABR3PD71_9PEZI